ncbi:MAG: hypothetical protein IKV25_02140 [Clostridia bacterium]|nr:hypothetical protein [Clostridia bacterium]
MKELKDFNTEKSIYIGKVLEHIHYKKLHTRIYEEISNHMDDMYEDFSSTCDDEKEITKKVLDEMGHPHYLGLELKKANKAKLFWARFFKITISISAIPLAFCIIILTTNIFSEIRPYFKATDIETKEMRIVEKYNNGEPIKFLFETEVDGIVHRYYLPEKQSESSDVYFDTQSIKVFGISVKDKFVEYGRSTGPLDNELTIQLGNSGRLEDSYLVLTAPADYKYVRFRFQHNECSIKNEATTFWGDYIEIPDDITYENPFVVFIDCPDDCYWYQREFYNENKEVVIPTIDDSNRSWSSSTTF